MTVLCEAGQFTSRTTVGVDTINLDSNIWGGATPKMVIMWVSGSYGAGITAHAVFGFGVAVSTSSQAAASFYSDDAASTTVAGRRMTASAVCTTHNSVVTAEEGTLNAFAANQFSINWTINTYGTAYVWNYLVLGGDDFEAEIETISSPTSSTTKEYSGCSFQPEALLAFGNMQSIHPGNETNGVTSIGFYDGTNHSCIGVSSRTALSTSVCASFHGAKLLADTYNQSDQSSCTVDSLDSDGATLDWTNTTATALYGYLVYLKGVSFKVLSGLTMPTSDGDETRNVGFTPKGALLISGMRENSASIEADARLMVGAWDSENNHTCAGMLDEDGQSTTDGDRFQSNDKAIQHYDHDQSGMGNASIAASGTDLVETWDIENNGLYEFEHAAFVIGQVAASANPVKSNVDLGIGM